MKTCLVVDDSKVIRMVARRILEGLSFGIAEAADGQKAIEACQEKMPDAVLLDWNMPVMNGIEFLKAVKQHPTSKFTPVIMLTTEAGDDLKQQGREAGAKAWIVKPFQPQTLLDAVAKLILP